MSRQILLVACATLGGCASPLHLTYDHGRAYTEAMTSQADLTRPAVANSQYSLYGTEAEAIRILVREHTTDEEKEESELKSME